MFVTGDPLRSPGPRGEQQRDSSFLIWLNADADAGEVTMPANEWVHDGEVVLSTDTGQPGRHRVARRRVDRARPRSLARAAARRRTVRRDGRAPAAARYAACRRPRARRRGQELVPGQHPDGVAERSGASQRRACPRTVPAALVAARPAPATCDLARPASSSASTRPCTTWTSTSSGVRLAERDERPHRRRRRRAPGRRRRRRTRRGRRGPCGQAARTRCFHAASSLAAVESSFSARECTAAGRVEPVDVVAHHPGGQHLRAERLQGVPHHLDPAAAARPSASAS